MHVCVSVYVGRCGGWGWGCKVGVWGWACVGGCICVCVCVKPEDCTPVPCHAMAAAISSSCHNR